eukprot:TRINITY_DN13436_c1_g1_i2.p1 TRINITY_DN13436_c1_g1~~TRINITY_DN13436_c1_g1_i2.p1  ORF type:complete len:204 (+),score=38.19 TRINITY_DN13436_c1_g1_i2:83-613(+)
MGESSGNLCATQESIENLDSKLSKLLEIEERKEAERKLQLEHPECGSYTVLSDQLRNHANKTSSFSAYCDYQRDKKKSGGWVGAGWYRLLPPAGHVIPETSPGSWHCGGQRTGYVNGTHPATTGESLDVTFCFCYGSGHECHRKKKGRITNCGPYYVYYLEEAPDCSARYCGADSL